MIEYDSNHYMNVFLSRFNRLFAKWGSPVRIPPNAGVNISIGRLDASIVWELNHELYETIADFEREIAFTDTLSDEDRWF